MNLVVADQKTGRLIDLEDLPEKVQLDVLKKWVYAAKTGSSEDLETNSWFEIRKRTLAEAMEKGQLRREIRELKEINAMMQRRITHLEADMSRLRHHNMTWGRCPGDDPVKLTKIYEAYLESLDEL